MPVLTAEQRDIALDTSHHLMVEAGAGSGKTTTLIEKLAHELGHRNIEGQSPAAPISLDQIAAITFTRKAAGEMKERLRAEFLRRANESEGLNREMWAEQAFGLDEALIGTIDAFAGRIIRDYGALAGVEAGYQVLDPGDAFGLRAEVVEQAILQGIDAQDPGAVFLVRQFGFLRARSILGDVLDNAALLVDIARRRDEGRLDWVDFAKKHELGFSVIDALLGPHAEELLSFALTAHQAYIHRMEREGALDHAHIVLKAAEIANHETVQAAFQERIRILFVDEHQDTNLAQVQLLFRLSGITAALAAGEPDPDPPLRLVLVGDPKQGIYGFRHADITMWRASRRAIERAGGRFCTLTANHRSRPELVRFYDDSVGRIMAPAEAETCRYEVPFRSLQSARPEHGTTSVHMLLAPEAGSASTSEVVADKIREMLQDPSAWPVFERQADGTEKPRPVQAKDIAILSRNLKGSADDYERALRERGVHAYVYGGRGLYGRQEVQDLAALLKAVADPYDPFALAAFLRSPLGGLDDVSLTELARASTAARPGESMGSLYDALLRAEDIVTDTNGQERAVRAASLLKRIRSLRDRLGHHQLLETAITETGYDAFLAGAPDAPAGLRNVEKLIRVARRAAEEPLFEFVRTLSGRVRRADPEDEAPLYTPDDDLIAISTIHKAKGLEWPYVFYVGMDEGLFRRVRTDEPFLSRDLGFALPLEVMVRHGDTEAHIPEQSATWAWYFEDATRREYAEAKRLFYVASTRAREGLFLAGALKQNRPERRLTGSIKWLHRQAPEHWLRHLYRPLTQSGEKGQSIEYGTGDVALIHRPDGEPEDVDAQAASQPLPVVEPRQWPAEPPSVIEANGLSTWPEAIESRIAPVVDRAVLRNEFTASELLKYDVCEWQHFYGYVQSISAPTIEAASIDATVNQILPEVRGDILHDYLSQHEDRWTEDECRQEMRRALLRQLPMADEEADENTDQLLAHARTYLESEWYTRVQKAKRVRREIPFVYQMSPTLRLRGILDLGFDEEDGTVIMDFKTGLFRGLEHKIDAEIQRRADDYEIQAGVYCLAAEAAGLHVKEFVFFFTSPGKTVRIVPDEAWKAGMRAKIKAIASRIQRQHYGEAPVWEKKKCQSCDLLPLCQPQGVPDDVQREAA